MYIYCVNEWDPAKKAFEWYFCRGFRTKQIFAPLCQCIEMSVNVIIPYHKIIMPTVYVMVLNYRIVQTE